MGTTSGHYAWIVGNTYLIKGISPITHKVAEFTLVADSAPAAKHRAEEAGFESVTVRLVPEPPSGEKQDNDRASGPQR